jgi:hypothetical protein
VEGASRPGSSSGDGSCLMSVDLASVLNDIIPTLGAASTADLDWCSTTELYNYADEEMKRLAASTSLWVSSVAIALAQNQAVVSLPSGCVSVIHVAWNYSPLRPASVWELAALDGAYPSTSYVPSRFSLDANLPGTLTIYPVPSTAGTLQVTFSGVLPDIASGSTVLPIASPLQDIFGLAMIGAARRKESDGCMAEVADHCEQRLEVYRSVLKQYFGEAS